LLDLAQSCPHTPTLVSSRARRFAPRSLDVTQACSQSYVKQPTTQWNACWHASDAAHACPASHPFASMHDWHEAAVSGVAKAAACAPQPREHADEHLSVRHASSAAAPVTAPTGRSSAHLDRQAGPPQAASHVAYAAQAGFAAHAADSEQQLDSAHEPQSPAGYASTHIAAFDAPGGSSWMSTSCRQPTPAPAITVAATSRRRNHPPSMTAEHTAEGATNACD